ncbi:MAG: BTAD domain-containing putative transcriptional regulator [Ornithinimicrobium sp.]
MGADPDTKIWVSVLGPLEARSDAGSIPLTSGNQRRLLASLLLARGRVVSLGHLADDIWGDDLPGDPRASVHTTVARLRRTLGPGAETVRARSPGYQLDRSLVWRDDDEFTTQLSAARNYAPPDGLDRLDAALVLWRGPAWGDLADDLARGEATRLEEQRLQALESRAESLLAQGRLGEAVSSLESIFVEDPLRERGVLLLMEAADRYGSVGSALDAFTRHREALAEQLGLDPSASVQRLHTRILRREQHIQPTEAGASSAPVEPTGQRPPADRSLPQDFGEDLIGRAEVLSRTNERLHPGTVLTLLGPGGVGKTALALAVCGRQSTCWWVDLTTATSAEDVVPAVIAATGAETAHGSSATQSLTRRLSTAQGLLVMDNCEHVLSAAATLADQVVRSCPGVRVLATSREGLGVAAEQLMPVSPLPVRGDAEVSPPVPVGADAEVGTPAVDLFLARARAVAPDLQDTPEVRSIVSTICQHLDGLPLAIELAAARTGTLTLEDLAERLQGRTDLLRSSSSLIPRRHQTLVSTMSWSYDLLTPEEQLVFRRLSIFVADFDLDTAERVLTSPDLSAEQVVHTLTTLVGRSMVVPPGIRGRGRYRLLETMRAFGTAELSADELERLRVSHADWIRGLASQAESGLQGPHEARWAERMVAVLPDLRSAVTWSLESQHGDVVVDIVASLYRWAYLSLRTEILDWADRLVERDADRQPGVLTAAALGAWVHGRYDDVKPWAQQALDLGGTAPQHARAVNLAHDILGDLGLVTGDLVGAQRHYEQATEGARRQELWADASMSLCGLALACTYAGQDAHSAAEEARLLARRSDNPSALAMSWYATGEALGEQNPNQALAVLERCRAIRTGPDQGLSYSVSLTASAAIISRHGPLSAQTLEQVADTVQFWVRSGNAGFLTTCLRNAIPLLERAGADPAALALGEALAAAEGGRASYGTEAERVRASLERAARRAPHGAGLAGDTTWTNLLEAASDTVTTLRRLAFDSDAAGR